MSLHQQFHQPQQQQLNTSQLRNEFVEMTHPVSRQEKEFAHMEYLIRMSLRSVSANIYRMYSLKHPKEVEQFKVNTGGGFFDVWFNMNSERMKDYSIEEIATEGFAIPETGLTVKTGMLRLDDDTAQDRTLNNEASLNMSLHGVKRKKIFKLLHCLVAPGKCFFVSNKLHEVVMPKGYNSIYLQPESTEDTSSPLYKHQYIIFDKNRLLPDYVIFLEYDPEGDSKLKVISSSSSEEYFETNEKIINEAYFKAKATVDNENPNASLETSMIEHEKYFAAARDHIDLLEKRRQEICENARNMENDLRDIFKRSISRLHEIAQMKLSNLLSDEAELRRRLEEVEWMNQFIHYQKQNVTPVNFLDSFAQHNKLKKERIVGMDVTLDNINLTLDQVKPDIQASGQMQVISPTTELQDDPEYRIVPIDENQRILFDEQGNMLTTILEEPGEENGIYLDDEALLVNKQDPNEQCRIS